MNNLESENIVIAIGVLSVLADEEYKRGADAQSVKWDELRGAIYHLTNIIEKIAKREVFCE